MSLTKKKQELLDAKLRLRLHETQPITQESIRKYQLLQMITERYELGFYFDNHNHNDKDSKLDMTSN